MKTIKLLMAALFAFAAGGVAAQPSALQEFQKKMNAVKSFSLKFDYLVQNNSSIESQESGTLSVNGGKYRLDMGSSLIVCDGAARYTYLKTAQEIVIETPNPLRDGIFSDLSAIFSINYEDFKVIKSGENANEVTFDLTPKQNGLPYQKITLGVSKNGHLPAKIVYYGTDERTTILIISNFKSNIKFAATDFVFDAKQYPQVEVVDMR